MRDLSVVTITGFLIVGSRFTLRAAAPRIAVVLIVTFFLAFGLLLRDTGVPSLMHVTAAPQHLGRVYLLWRQFAEAGIAVGLLLGGPAVGAPGRRAALVLQGGYIVVVAVVFVVLRGRPGCHRGEISVGAAVT